MTTADETDARDWEAENRAELDRLNAKQWRGGCPACLGQIWCADTEEEGFELSEVAEA